MVATILTIWLVAAAPPPNVKVEPPTKVPIASNPSSNSHQAPVEPVPLKPTETVHKRGLPLPPPPVIGTLGGGGHVRRSVPPEAVERLAGSEQTPYKGGGDDATRGGSNESKPGVPEDHDYHRDK